MELPVHLPREVNIIKVYDDTELAAVGSLLSSGALTKRDKAYTLIPPVRKGGAADAQ